jgi:hypothetical protein
MPSVVPISGIISIRNISNCVTSIQVSLDLPLIFYHKQKKKPSVTPDFSRNIYFLRFSQRA